VFQPPASGYCACAVSGRCAWRPRGGARSREVAVASSFRGARGGRSRSPPSSTTLDRFVAVAPAERALFGVLRIELDWGIEGSCGGSCTRCSRVHGVDRNEPAQANGTFHCIVENIGVHIERTEFPIAKHIKEITM